MEPNPHTKKRGRRSMREVLHELQIHQIELQQQYESLRQTQLALEESRDNYADLYDFAPIGYVTLAPSGLIDSINMTGAKMLGDDGMSLIGRRFAALVSNSDRERWNRYFLGMTGGRGLSHCELRLEPVDGHNFLASFNGALSQNGMIRIAFTDVTQQRRTEEENRVSAIAFETQEAIAITDREAVIIKVNHAFSRITGYEPHEVVGRKINMLKSGRQDENFYKAMWDRLKQFGSWQGELWNRHKNGAIYPEWLTITAVTDEHGEICNYVSTMTDITQRKNAENEIRLLAFYDPLTGLPNRRLLLDRLQQALITSVRSKKQGALLFIDLDNFKLLNDTLGHASGDQLLILVGQRLSLCVRDGDTVARLGGDEFVVMLEQLSSVMEEAADQVVGIGQKILAALNQPYQLEGHLCHNTASIGISLFDNHEVSYHELLKRADLAMYGAKTSGRNTMRFFDPLMQAAVHARANLDNALRKALRKGELLLHYQPCVNVDGIVTGAEALLRWQQPERGMVAPGEFIAFAEESGMILQIGDWVLKSACAQLVRWTRSNDHLALTLSINVSARQFHDKDFVSGVIEVLQQSGVDPHRLKLEVTESLLLHNVDDIIGKMKTLKMLGISFSLDDFGTGYSSLAYLRRLPLNELKIDRSFVRDVMTNPNDAVIARTIIALAKSLGLAVMAEGVETAEQRDFLVESGCDGFQGYFFSHPLEVTAFNAFAGLQ